MKIRLLSDLHQEFYEDKRVYGNLGEDILIIAGDLAVGAKNVVQALMRFSINTADIIYIPGNHEFYNQNMDEFNDYVKRFTYGSNIHFLNPGFTRIKDVTFIGGTLWSEFNKDNVAKFTCSRSINDFHSIKGFNTDKCVELYVEHAKFIKEAYEKLPGKKVIVTHFLPDTACISTQYRGPDPLNTYFANQLGNWISELKDVPYWLFGHTHDNVDVTIGETRCIANPYGYYHNASYKELVIEV